MSVYLFRLGGVIIASPNLFRALVVLTPFAAAVVVVVGFVPPKATLARLVIRCISTSLAACVPGESLVYIILDWKWRGSDIFLPSNLPTLMIVLLVWALIVAAAGLLVVATTKILLRTRPN